MNSFLCLLALTVVGVLANQQPVPRASNDLGAVLNAHGGFGRILGLLNATGLTNQLLQEENMTLFLPTNDALAKMPADYLDLLLADPQKLEEVLSYHVVLDQVGRIHNDQELTSMSNQKIRINYYSLPRFMTVEGVELTVNALHVHNGYVYGIDGFMTPPQGEILDILVRRNDEKFTTQMLTKANMVDYLHNDHNITMFAPTDAAWAKMDPAIMTYLDYNPATVAEILKYHMINRETLYSIGMRHSMTFESANGHRDHLMILEKGDDIFVNHAKVLEKDISANNGVLYIIDEVLIPIRVTLEIESQGLPVGK